MTEKPKCYARKLRNQSQSHSGNELTKYRVQYIIAKVMTMCILHVLSSFRLLHSPRHPTPCETFQSHEWVLLWHQRYSPCPCDGNEGGGSTDIDRQASEARYPTQLQPDFPSPQLDLTVNVN
ncbi:hypothetical protein CY34DRAFT_340977 [Suillus luteus UH-Slu-Lm8-n1]|uniref:Uncharacterized protein n=1 Tax=Suillus luteus UH-Slu-Lm8-n1 TaxID=930992 RepID=A0A0D0AMK5_9AGAM|nr:hypothetical protein CY34DRAFT_340977 [Suillus luteus UH-Slu-Lm8-n1]